MAAAITAPNVKLKVRIVTEMRLSLPVRRFACKRSAPTSDCYHPDSNEQIEAHIIEVVEL